MKDIIEPLKNLLVVLVPFCVLALIFWLADRKGKPAKPERVAVNKERYFDDPGYRHSRQNTEDLIYIAGIAEQRKSNRFMGQDIDFYIGRQKGEFEAANHVTWLVKHGKRNGVHLHLMDGNQEITYRQWKRNERADLQKSWDDLYPGYRSAK